LRDFDEDVFGAWSRLACRLLVVFGISVVTFVLWYVKEMHKIYEIKKVKEVKSVVLVLLCVSLDFFNLIVLLSEEKL